jgi:hypothetical protein
VAGFHLEVESDGQSDSYNEYNNKCINHNG